MAHYTYDEWVQYVRDELPEQMRRSFEDHLYSCDDCLELFMQAMEKAENELPSFEDDGSFAEGIMEKVGEWNGTDKQDEKIVPFYQKTIFQYGIAAAMTIILMASGAFKPIFDFIESNDDPQPPSITEEMMEKTIGWVDELTKTKEEVKE